MNRKIKHLLIIFFLTSSILGSMFLNPVTNPSVKAAGWWHSDWNEFIVLTIDEKYINTTLTNFPVLVVLNATVSAVCDSGNSIRFLNINNASEYYYEIEDGVSGWNAAGTNYIWVNITKISGEVDTKFLMYYNNTGASDNSNPAGVWDSNYQCVYHMNESAGNIQDSTRYGNSGSKASTPDYSQNGQIGDAIQFNGADEAFSGVLTAESIDLNNSFIEYWCEPDVAADTGTVLGWVHTTNNRFYFGQVAGTTQWVVGFGNQYEYYGAADTNWHYFSTNITTGSVYHSYVDNTSGAQEDSLPFSSGSPVKNVSDIYIGYGTAYFDGLIDEVRISNSSRNESWRSASYHTMKQTAGFISQSQNSTQTQFDPITNLLVNTTSYTAINLTWDKGTGSTHTRIQYSTSAYPATLTAGTTIYNDTNDCYDHTSLTAQETYYYSLWAYNSTGSTYSPKVTGINYTGCGNPTSVTATVEGTNVNISWVKGTRADATRLIRGTSTYPATALSGTLLQNTSRDYFVEAIGTTYRYKVYSYDNATGLFSSGVEVSFGSLAVNCYDEETNESLTYSLFVTDFAGDDTYYKEHCGNPTNINVNDLPLGESISIKVSANESYNNISEYFSGFGFTENQTITYIALMTAPSSKESVNITCMNTTAAPDTKSYPTFTLTGDLITILPHAASEFDRVWVNYSFMAYQPRYYNRDFIANTFYTLDAYLPPTNLTDVSLYIMTVQNDLGNGINDARLVIKRYLSFVDAFATVSSVHTDATGKASAYLIPNEIYKVTITKTDYETTTFDYIPPLEDRYYTFQLPYEEFTPTPQLEAVTINGYISGTTLYVNYTDPEAITSNTTIYIYERNYSTFTTSLLTTNLTYWDDSFQFSTTINRSNAYYVYVHYNRSGELHNAYTLIFERQNKTTITNQSTGDKLFQLIYGNNPFGWTNTFMFIFMVFGFFAFGQRGAGIMLVMIGFITIFINNIVGFNTAMSLFAGGALPILIIIIGIMIARRNLAKEGRQ